MSLTYAELFQDDIWSIRHYSAFLLRRFARIYPLYVFVTLILAANAVRHALDAVAPFDWRRFFVNVLQNIFLIQAWGGGEPIDGPSWSVSTELAAYLIFPGLLACTVFVRPRAQVFTLSICYVSLIWITTLTPPDTYPWPRMGPLDIAWPGSVAPVVRCVAEFVIGLALCRMASHPLVSNLLASRRTDSALALLLLLCLCLPRSDLAVIVLASVLLVVLTAVEGPVARVLGSHLALFLGNISYAIYLLHYPLRFLYDKAWAHLSGELNAVTAHAVALGLYYAAVLLSAWASFHFSERPCRTWIKQFEALLISTENTVRTAGEGRLSTVFRLRHARAAMTRHRGAKETARKSL